MATQVDEQSIELTRDSLEGLSERSSTSAESGDGGPVSETAAQRFSAVHWETPPEETETRSEESSDMSDGDANGPAGPVDATARQRFADVCWEEPPDEPAPETDDGQSEWSEKMKLENFFDDAGW